MSHHVIFVFGISVLYATLFELRMFTVHLFKNALAGQFRFAAALANPRACMGSEQHGDSPLF